MCATVAAANPHAENRINSLYDAFSFVVICDAVGVGRFNSECLDYVFPYLVPSCGMETFIDSPVLDGILVPVNGERHPRQPWIKVDDYGPKVTNEEREVLKTIWMYRVTPRKLAAAMVLFASDMFHVLTKPSHIVGFVASRFAKDASARDDNVSDAVSLLRNVGLNMSEYLSERYKDERRRLLGRFVYDPSIQE